MSDMSISHRGPRARSWPDRIFLALAILGYGFLCLLAGMTIVAFKIFPYGFVRDAWLGAQAALYFVEPEDRTGWRRSDEAGVHRYDPARAHNGVTLYTSGHAQKAFLIDMQGKVLHEWHAPRSAAWSASGEPRNSL